MVIANQKKKPDPIVEQLPMMPAIVFQLDGDITSTTHNNSMEQALSGSS